MTRPVMLTVDLADTEMSRRALDAAVDLARLHGAALHVVSVLPDFGMSMVGNFFSRNFEKEALHKFGEALSGWVNENVPGDLEVHPHVLHGSIYDEILRAADRLDAGVIVLGAHRPDLKDYLLGPNAARVVRHARQSVYVVRA